MASKTSQVCEYSVSVWKIDGLANKSVLQRCVGFSEGGISTRKKAAEHFLEQAVSDGLLKAGDRYEVDVSEDADDEWYTALSGTV